MDPTIGQSTINTPGQAPVPVIVTPQSWLTNSMQTLLIGAMFGLLMTAIGFATSYLHAWQLEIDAKQQQNHADVVRTQDANAAAIKGLESKIPAKDK
jgi:hypothetical protein